MKRYIIALLAILLVVAIFTSCKAKTTSAQPSIVCTIFPQYDWVLQILGEKASGFDITLLSANSIDLHNFQPSVSDIVTISTCDLFIYVGGESDSWVENALTQSKNKNMIVINLLELLGEAVKIEEVVEGMEAEEEADEAEADEEDEAEYDEHVWLSLRNAQPFCIAITQALSEIDKVNADIYRQNLAGYLEKLSALDTQYKNTISTAPNKQPAQDTLKKQNISTAPTKTILVGDRFPFRYLVDDYGLNYFAAFVGCSAETEASFETIIFLARKLNELNLKYIIVTESSDQSIAKTIRDNTATKDQQIVVLNAMQSIGVVDIDRGVSYLSIMESNLDVLKKVLQ